MAHLHEDSDTYYLDQLCLIALSAAFGGVCLTLYFLNFSMLKIMLAGAGLLAGCVCLNLSGIAIWQFWSGLVLLGLGWNFLYIGGSSLLTEAYLPEERAKTQATNDFLVFGMVTIASFASGALHHAFGWQAVNLGVIAPVAVTGGATVWLLLRRRPATA